MYVLHLDVRGVEPRVDPAQRVKAPAAPVHDDEACGTIDRVRPRHKADRDRGAGAPRSQAEHLSPGAPKVTRAEQRIERPAGGYRVLRVADDPAMLLGDARDFLSEQGIGVKLIKEVAGSAEQVDLMCRD